MILFKETFAFTNYISQLKKLGKSIGFVPTMGALHNGHLSLIQKSIQKCDVTVCSIFVNPTQFNNKNDFDKYPNTIENDIYQLETTGCDILFLPSLWEMYPNGILPKTAYDFGKIEYVLEGEFRPGHFQGVGQIVHKLLDIILPDYLFLGQKDFQQCMIIKKLIQLIGYTIHLEIEETLRETSGLAMSSRNLRLSEDEKEKASAIYRALTFIKENQQNKSARALEQYAKEYLLANGFEKIDYVFIAKTEDLSPVQEIDNNVKTVALVAAYIGGVRLIDNLLLN